MPAISQTGSLSISLLKTRERSRSFASMFAALNRSTLQLNALLPPQDLRNLRNEGPTYSVGLVNPGAVAIAYAVVHECVKG